MQFVLSGLPDQPLRDPATPCQTSGEVSGDRGFAEMLHRLGILACRKECTLLAHHEQGVYSKIQCHF